MKRLVYTLPDRIVAIASHTKRIQPDFSFWPFFWTERHREVITSKLAATGDYRVFTAFIAQNYKIKVV